MFWKPKYVGKKWCEKILKVLFESASMQNFVTMYSFEI